MSAAATSPKDTQIKLAEVDLEIGRTTSGQIHITLINNGANLSAVFSTDHACRILANLVATRNSTNPPRREFPRDTRNDGAPWTEPDRSGGGGHTPDEIARAAGDVW